MLRKQKKNTTTKIEKSKSSNDETTENPRFGSGEIKITDISIEDSNGERVERILQGERFDVVVEYKKTSDIEFPIIGISIFRLDGLLVYGTHTQIDEVYDIDLYERGTIKICFWGGELSAGEYNIDFAITSNMMPVDYFKQALKFQVVSSTEETGLCVMKHRWEFLDA